MYRISKAVIRPLIIKTNYNPRGFEERGLRKPKLG